ncbi:MAG: hypothetical protein IKO91_04035 [Oscillospiraceae bacterium]|nr:hypothetical protein [Oscillospiraceae bacterium]
MKRRIFLYGGFTVLLLLAVMAVFMLHSWLEYRIMDSTERLKAQLMQEYRVYSSQLFEKIEVKRPWLSLSPENWTFAVTFASDHETVLYRRTENGFVPESGEGAKNSA